MRRIILSSIFALSILSLAATLAWAQSSSPESLYDRGVDAITGVGPSRNDTLGIDYFRQSAELGYGPAQIALGYYYETGTVVATDPAQAVDLYRKAAQQGDPLAGWLAGRRYYLGSGVPRDLDAARKWFKISADQNSAYGVYYLGRVMDDKDYAKADNAKAAALYKVAADQGLPQAQYFYAKALKDGRGIAKDPFTAYIWYSIAADAGYAAANADLGELNNNGALTVDQITTARAKARDMEQVVIRAVTARGCSGWDGEFDEFPTPPPPKLQRFCH
ncbi:MAG TPA: tetratricopeptide repeat protein [Terriglobales bacterium]|jgi:TPR repeat protein|nr:tetratricopeptide repeat protein [Terriglobales bacterium]